MTMTNIRFYRDRCARDSLPADVLGELEKHGLAGNRRGQEFTVYFCGAVLTDDSVSVFLPRGSVAYSHNEDQSCRLASDLINSVYRYASRSETKEVARDSGFDLVGMAGIDLIFKLLRDYRTNGLFRSRYRENVINKGKPDWKRTVQQETPFPSVSGNPVYLDIHGRSQNHFGLTETSRIHAAVIRKLDKTYSWMLSGKQIRIARELEEVPQPQGGYKKQINILKTELRNTYSERDMWLIKMLISYLDNAAGNSLSNNVIGVSDFHHAWEHMAGQVLGHTFDLNKIMPVPVYRDKSDKLHPQRGKKQKGDIGLISENKTRVAIVDAKYYGTDYVKQYPGFSDLVKQFFYAKSLKGVLPEGTEIHNYLLFPGEEGEVNSIHVYTNDLATELSDDYQPICCKWLDPIQVIQHYNAGKKLAGFSELLLST